jgi:hypothetical protein
MTCEICNFVHVFKVTKNGFIVCNDQYVKIKDEAGYVNYFGNMIKFKEEDLKKVISEKQMMDFSIYIS